ncbi:hypothetical protein, partial [Streptomyces muensis]|uniref:hypothetical protein n=1 Tax=Streptomyces muensis TaxID=1077944 RepID=UPI0027E3AE2B
HRAVPPPHPGAVGDVDCAADVAGVGRRDGSMSVRASRAGACTTSGSMDPTGCGAGGWDGAAGPPDGGGYWTVVQPARAETATVTRSVAVVVVRCTRQLCWFRRRLGQERR